MGSKFSWSAATSGAVIAGILAVTVWWFIRRRRREMRFPIARILDLPRKRLPRLVLRQPPWVPFVLFTLCALAFVVWSVRPRRVVFTAQEPRQTRVHIVLDMSPSMSAHGTVAELSHKVRELWEQNTGAARITFATTHSDTIYDMQNIDQVEDVIKGLGYHRGGVRIGNAVKQQLAQAGDLDRLYIVSDRDEFSWSGFQWQYLLDDADVYHVNFDPHSDGPAKSNAFIQGARLTSSPGSLSEDWEVEIAQGGTPSSQEGTLRATWRGETLASTSWVMTASRRSANVVLSWPHTKTPQNVGDDPIIWEITVQGEDAIEMDNQFRSHLSNDTGRARVVAEPLGELMLEDPVTSLMTALRVDGLQAARFDGWSQGTPWENPGLSIFVGGLGRGTDGFCPMPGTKDGSQTQIFERDDARVWIIPWQSQADYGELCACVRRWASGDMPTCDSMAQRDAWIKWLIRAGGHQVGGDIGENNQAAAFGFGAKSGGADVLAFTVPLKPSSEFGISHGEFPLMVRGLIGWHSGRQLHGVETSTWLRIQDMSTEGSQGADDANSSRQKSVRWSNVPMGESQLVSESAQQLPPEWTGVQSSQSGRANSKRDAEDPLPWIWSLFAVACSATFAEIIWYIVRRRKTRLRARANVQQGLVIIAVCGAILGAFCQSASAQIQINYFNNSNVQSARFQQLSREVSGRTSIDFLPKPMFFESLDDSALEQPWLWLKSTDRAANADGTMEASLVQWVKRGGLLVIESSSDDATWERFVKPLMVGTFKPTGWRAVPPDHELMRSFYLLESLPMCSGKVWRWFGMDGRLALVHIPFSFSASLQDQPQKPACEGLGTPEYQSRVFVNLMMVALTTDYKRDQIHLPEILKRLRSP